MRRLLNRAARRLSEQSGFTLLEGLVVSGILAAVLTAILAPFDFAQRQAPKNVEYAHAISDASSGLQQIMREIREAYRVNSTTPNSIDFNAVIRGSDLEIAYECDEPYPTDAGNNYASQYHRCLRVSVATGGTLPLITSGAVVIDRLLNGTASNPVFTFLDSSGSSNPISPTYVEANVQVPARGPLNSGLNHTITLDNATALPNLQNG
jgi:type II secretory pathway pseudopilin PulG